LHSNNFIIINGDFRALSIKAYCAIASGLLLLVLAVSVSFAQSTDPQNTDPQNKDRQSSVTAIALFKDRVMLSVDGGRAKIVGVGSTYEGVKVLSSNTESATVELNGQRETLTLNSTVAISGELGVESSGIGGFINLTKKRDGHFHTVGQLNGRTINFLVDTGASIVVLSSQDAKRIGLEYEHGFVATASTASGDSPMYTIKANKINVGSIEINDVSVGVIEGRFPVTPLLGMSFLGELDMTQTGRTLKLEQRQ